MMNVQYKKAWKKKLIQKVKSLKSQGYDSFKEIVSRCEGAQPKDVKAAILESLEDKDISKKVDLNYKTKFFFNIPAPNPQYYQWWYTLESQERGRRRDADGSRLSACGRAMRPAARGSKERLPASRQAEPEPGGRVERSVESEQRRSQPDSTSNARSEG